MFSARRLSLKNSRKTLPLPKHRSTTTYLLLSIRDLRGLSPIKFYGVNYVITECSLLSELRSNMSGETPQTRTTEQIEMKGAQNSKVTQSVNTSEHRKNAAVLQCYNAEGKASHAVISVIRSQWFGEETAWRKEGGSGWMQGRCSFRVVVCCCDLLGWLQC